MTTDRWAEAAVGLTVELMRNRCINDGTPDSGNEIVSVRTVQAFLGEEGIVVEPHPGRASAVFRIDGTDPQAPTVLLIPHLDVVPANADEWSFDPYDGTRSDGFVWGRGAVDMLNVTAAMITLFRAIRNGILPKPAGDLILAVVADEEAGGVYGARHLAEEHWDLVSADFVLTEVAGPTLPSNAGPALPVTVAEKGPAWRAIRGRGVAGHGSQPYARDNAVLKMADAFTRIGSSAQPVHISDEWRAFAVHLPLAPDMIARLLDADGVDEAIAELAEDDHVLARWIHACTHLTFSPNKLVGGTKANMVPDRSEGEIDVRLLPGQDATDIDGHLRKVLGPDLYDEFEIEPVLEMRANASAPEGLMWNAIADAAEEHLGSRALAPTLTPVTTDARFFRERGVPSYGVGLFDDTITFAEMLGMFHGADERVSEESIMKTAEFLATVIERFSVRASH